MAESGVTEERRTVSDDEVSQLDARAEEAAIINGQLVGSTLRVDWGAREGGEYIFTLDWALISANSQVYVSVHEGGFIGGARYTVHNIAPFDNGVAIRVRVDWDEPVTLIADYLIL